MKLGLLPKTQHSDPPDISSTPGNLYCDRFAQAEKPPQAKKLCALSASVMLSQV